MQYSKYRVAKMDCPCEENLIRMSLEGMDGIHKLEFDLAESSLVVFHCIETSRISQALNPLGLAASLVESNVVDAASFVQEDESRQRKLLWTVLAINFAFFLVELLSGILSKSMGLVADSLDMLADAFVYGMSLMVVGAALARKKRVALFSCIIQLFLAVLGLIELLRRFLGLELMPDFQSMIGVSALALVANATCLWLLQRSQSKEAHMRASIIFSANDVIINLGVIAAGLLVWIFDSKLPDLIVGVIIFLIVIRGAYKILSLARN